MKKTGIVTEVNKKYVCILTSSGEFVKIRCNNSSPSIGQIYSGELYSVPNLRLPIAAASLAFVIFSGGFYSYFSPAYAVTVDINPSVKLHVNMWDKVIRVEGVNEDGKKLLSEININNMSIEGGLQTIVEEAKKDNYIDEGYTETGNEAIKITLEGKEHSSAIQHFTDTLKSKNVNLQIIENGNIIEPNENKKNDKSPDNKPTPQENKQDSKPMDKENKDNKENKENENNKNNKDSVDNKSNGSNISNNKIDEKTYNDSNKAKEKTKEKKEADKNNGKSKANSSSQGPKK